MRIFITEFRGSPWRISTVLKEFTALRQDAAELRVDYLEVFSSNLQGLDAGVVLYLNSNKP